MKTNFIQRIFSAIYTFGKDSYYKRYEEIIKNSAAEYEESVNIVPPFTIMGAKNIHIGRDVSIGRDALFMSARAKIYIGDKSFSGPGLTIITGDHPYLVGSYMRDIRKDIIKETVDISKYDSDVHIEKDVWIGANVTILKGVTIGRGAIIASGAVVSKSVPPYSITGGVPARHIKFKWSVDSILEHEHKLYPESERLTKEELETIFTENNGR